VPRLGLTFDMRRPAFASTSLAEQYAAMLDVAEYADRSGFDALMFNEHHASEDGYLPSPLVATAGVAARTSRLLLRPLIVAPLYEPLKLAEDLAITDQLSGGRLQPVLGAGYRREDFHLFGVDPASRRPRLLETIEVLRRAWTGEPFELEGRTVRVTPRPAQDPGPPILLGGMSRTAARIAAQVGDGFFPAGDRWWDVYREECAAAGKPDPGPPAQAGGPMFLHVSEDPERDRPRIAPYLLSAIALYREWALENAAGLGAMPPQFAPSDEDELRTSPHYRFLTPEECVPIVEAVGPDGFFVLRPLWGGYEPELALSSLQLFVERVLPRVA